MVTQLTILTAMGAEAAGANLLGGSTVHVLRPGHAVPLDGPAELRMTVPVNVYLGKLDG